MNSRTVGIYFRLNHWYHDSMRTSIQSPLHHPCFSRRYSHDGWSTGWSNSTHGKIHFMVGDVAMFTIYQHPLLARNQSSNFVRTWTVQWGLTSNPSPPIVLASVYPGNSIHCPTQGAPPAWARSRAARRRVFPVPETMADLNSSHMLL